MNRTDAHRFAFICSASALCACQAAYAQATLPVTSIDVVAGIDAVDDGIVNQSFTDQDLRSLGVGLSLTGDTLVLGNTLLRSQLNNDDVDHLGHVITLLRDPLQSGVWSVAAYDTLDPALGPLPEKGDLYGRAVVVVDPFLFVASRRYDAYDISASPPALIAESPGAVFVYTRLGAFPAQWIPFQTIQNPSPIEGERFGHSIDYQDGTLVVSAHRAYDAGAPAMQINDCGVVGEVCIFEYSPMNNAFELQTSYRYDQTPTSYTSSVPCIPQIPPVPDNGRGRGAGFGKSVAIDGDWIVVGSDASEEVAVFERDAVSGWAFHSFLENSFTSSNNINDFGTSVAIDQNRIVVGSKKQSADTVPGEIGAVTLFEYDHEIDEWVGVDHVQAPDVMTNTTNPRFGRSVYLDGDLFVVSCQGNSNGSPLPPPGYGDVAEVYTFVIDPTTSEMVPQGRVYFNGEGNGYREQNQELGIAYDPVSGMIITGDINETDAENNQVRLFPACAADLDGDLAITPNDGTVFSTLYLAGDVRVDFAAPYGVLDFADVVRFNRLVGLGCP